jgi:alpha-glucosidase
MQPILRLMALCAVSLACALPAAATYYSPNGLVGLDLREGDHLTFQLSFGGRTALLDSNLGLTFRGQGSLTRLRIQTVGHESHDSRYELPAGKARHVRDRYEQFTFKLNEIAEPGRILKIVFRLYDDGAGFRYVIPKQPLLHGFEIERELTTFAFPGDPDVAAVEHPFDTSNEGFFTHAPLSKFFPGRTMILPALIHAGEGAPWVGLTEAALTDYAGLFLTSDGSGALEAKLAPSQADPAVKVRGVTPFASPWRVILLGDAPGRLLESNLVNNLNEPSKIIDTRWIHPGKVIFPWWNDYHLDPDFGDSDPSHQPGLNSWSLKKYVDFASENHFSAISLDGYDQAWYGGNISPPLSDANVTKAISAIDLPGVLAYAKARGVRARLWLHRRALESSGDMNKVFALYESWGIEGVMIDFVDHDDQESVRFHTRVIETAARHHLTVNFHGIWKPTGLTRTYPNLLSHEGVRSSEYNRFPNAPGVTTPPGAPPEHEAWYTWVRQLAGPTDIHPGSFNPVMPENFDMSRDYLRAMGTLARQLALYVVVESGVPMVVDAPREYRKRPIPFQFVQQVPSAWDELRVVAGEPGQFIGVARRDGADWYLGMITDRQPRAGEIPLTFLEPGRYVAEIYADGPGMAQKPDSLAYRQLDVRGGESFHYELAASGGLAVLFHRALK